MRFSTVDLTSQVSFYVPDQRDYEGLPWREEDVWSWVCAHPKRPAGKIVWTLYTYLVLKHRGFNCELVRQFPRQGIVISHRDFLPATLQPNPHVFLICIKADRKHHSWANFHLVQNSDDPIATKPFRQGTEYIPFWPQASLIPRLQTRGQSVSSICYFGLPRNLAPELRDPSWAQELSGHGLNWAIYGMQRWHDYSSVDVTVSVRGFGASHRSDDPTQSSDSKPPTKLINSWIAGVPAIVGNESAYKAVRKSPLDFIVVESKSDLLDALIRLQSNPELYQDMVENAAIRSQEFSVDSMANTWVRVLDDKAQPAYERWKRNSAVYRSFVLWTEFFRYWASIANVRTAFRGLKHG